MSTLPIGMFDSGVGGLTVLKAVHSLLPGENLVYLGDTARLPYGAKSTQTIVRYTIAAAGKLLEYRPKLLVIACNTATAAALPTLASLFAPVPVLGVVEPGADAAVAATRSGRIAVIGTESTIAGKAYERAIHARMPEAEIVARACPLLVPMAEEGWTEGPEAEAVARRYLTDIFASANAPDTLLLGCTHFPLFEPLLRTLLGRNVQVVDSARSTAKVVRQVLEEKGLLNANQDQDGSMRFFTTDNAARFAHAGQLFLARPMTATDVELVDL